VLCPLNVVHSMIKKRTTPAEEAERANGLLLVDYLLRTTLNCHVAKIKQNKRKYMFTIILNRIVLIIFVNIIFLPSSQMMRLHYLKNIFFKQSINLSAIGKISLMIRSPNLLIPSIQLPRLNDLDLNYLRSKNIEAVLFDKDNTLTFTYVNSLHPSIKDTISEVNSKFNIAILSNSVGSCDDIDFKEAKLVEEYLNIRVIRHMIKKPGCIKEV